MQTHHFKNIIEQLNNYLASCLEAAVEFAQSRRHYEVSIEHLIVKILERGDADMLVPLKHYQIIEDDLWQALLANINKQSAGNQGKPLFSLALFKLLEQSVVANSLYYKQEQLGSISLLDAFIESAAVLPDNILEILKRISLNDMRRQSWRYQEDNADVAAIIFTPKTSSDEVKDTALARFTNHITAKARAGKIDPIFGRDLEIRMMIDILSRRRKNNPILVGDPGVGKTALVEGLALKITEKLVPESLYDIEIHTLDLGLLQAGAGVKGEFEKRLQQVIEEVQQSIKPIILFIDEAHTLIGAGGAAGGSDAANLLKPALARGELRTIAATTWSEYKQYFERDAALDRRFQLIKVEEPTDEKAIQMLTGLKKYYQDFHKINIQEAALTSAVTLSRRYISGKQLPDKAIDLIDTAAARVKMAQQSPLSVVENLRSLLDFYGTQLADKKNQQLYDTNKTLAKEIKALEDELLIVQNNFTEAETQWKTHHELIKQLNVLQQEAIAAIDEKVRKQKQKAINQLKKQLIAVNNNIPLELDASMIADVIADLTGVPVSNLLKDDMSKLQELETLLQTRVLGQDTALMRIASAIRTRRLGLGKVDGPQGVFLLAGPSGVGKTETARAIADTLFGGERFLTTINMSEYQEAHTVSQLKGSPPGYVGYGEGGILTEAVRQRPYSVVLLDEIEKAHPDVLNLFYQVFDRGIMRDGEGREINFTNTIIIMTSNLGAEIIEDKLEQDNTLSMEQLATFIEPALLRVFAPALLARMQVIPYLPLQESELSNIAALKLEVLAKRLQDTYKIALRCDKAVLKHLGQQARKAQRGARAINHLIENDIEPAMARSLLQFLIADRVPKTFTLEHDETNGLSMLFT